MILKCLLLYLCLSHMPGALNKGGTKEIFVKYKNEEKHSITSYPG